MGRVGSLLIVIALLLVGVGFYRGWLALTSTQENGSNKVDVKLVVDPDKIQADTTPGATTK